MAESFEQLSERFVAEAREQSDAIAGLLAAVDAGGDGLAARAEIRELAHKIKGAAGIFGFAELKSRAAELELAAEAGPDAPLEPAVTALAAALPG